MQFRTEFHPEPSKAKISHDDKIMLIGSCFSEHIGHKLKQSGFRVNSNPFGTLFNPDSIRNCLRIIGTNKKFKSKEFFEYQGVWHHFSLHGDLSGTDLDETVENVNNAVTEANDFLMNADVLILTFGTAWVYELIETGKTVANCHKVPNSKFTKRKLGVNDIVSDMSWVLNHLVNINPDIRVLFTISPVRHLADGFVENQWSKSTLNVAVHELIRRYDCATYFPSYELVMDDLRDYRFFESDLLHPNQQAIEYTWKKFEDVFFSDKTKKLADECLNYHRGLAHRPFHPDSSAHKKFLVAMEKEYQKLQKEIPWL